MRHIDLKLLWALLAPVAVLAQPRVGVIDFYGRAKVSETQIRKVLPFKEGDGLPRSKGDVEEAIEQIPNVTRARLEAACCEDGKAILYVGIEEKGGPHFDYNPPGTGTARLPEEVHGEYAAFLGAVNKAVRSGETSEDLRQGHSLMSNPGARAHQERFTGLAKEHQARLREVLRTSSDEEHRAIAAYVLGYAPRKADVLDDLQFALRDPDDTVRNNAMRAVGAIAVLAMRQPELEIRVSPTWFVEMLNSLIWSDKTTAAVTLVTLTERRDADLLAHIRERALGAIVEMASWKHLPHALPAFILAGRIAGVAEDAIQAAWAKGDRQAVLAKLRPAKK